MAGQSLTKEEYFQRHKDRKISENEKINKTKNKNLNKTKIEKAKYQWIIHENVNINK
jgi:hypothetical protein